MKIFRFLILILFASPGFAEDSVSEVLHGVKTTKSVLSGAKLTNENTSEFERTEKTLDKDAIKSLNFERHPKASFDLREGVVLRTRDFFYTYEPRAVKLGSRKNGTLQTNVRTPESNHNNLGDFDKTQKKNIFNPKTERGKRETGQPGFTK